MPSIPVVGISGLSFRDTSTAFGCTATSAKPRFCAKRSIGRLSFVVMSHNRRQPASRALFATASTSADPIPTPSLRLSMVTISHASVVDRVRDQPEALVPFERDETGELRDAVYAPVSDDRRRTPALGDEPLEPVPILVGQRTDAHHAAYHPEAMTTVMVRVRAARALRAPVGARS
jgi:hypothetical protein